jgi:citrate lyase acyl carrier protein
MPEQASAGRRDAKADLIVTMTKGGPPENEVRIESSAIHLFGKRIEEVVRWTLEKLGVRNTQVVVNDRAAFDWVIMARTPPTVLGFRGR